MIVRSPYDPTAVARLRGCGCHAPAQARIVAERTARSSRRRRVRDDSHEAALAGAGADPIVLGAGHGSKCRPFLTVQKDQERFAACNALADSIGPLDSSEQAFKLIEEAFGAEVNEIFGIITLDLHLRMKSIAETGRGEPSAVMAPMVPTLQAALIDGAHAVIIAHVHPSGVPAEPSDADKETTEAFAEAFNTVGIGLLDHIIVGGDSKRRSYFSFLDSGLLPPLDEDL
jgi:DNA repair protein RadC